MVYHICSAILFLLTWEAGAADLTTRVSCPNTPGYQCSSDCKQLGYCDGSNWNLVYSCPSGQLCVNGACGNYASCPAKAINYDILCSDPNLKMPDLEDPDCQNYYSCTARTSSETGYGLPEECDSGKIFDSCSGQCINGVCSALDYPNSCEQDGIFQAARALSRNNRLAFVCIPDATGIKTLWLNCSDGYFVSNAGSVVCTSGLNNGCDNGRGSGGRVSSDPGDPSDPEYP